MLSITVTRLTVECLTLQTVNYLFEPEIQLNSPKMTLFGHLPDLKNPKIFRHLPVKIICNMICKVFDQYKSIGSPLIYCNALKLYQNGE